MHGHIKEFSCCFYSFPFSSFLFPSLCFSPLLFPSLPFSSLLFPPLPSSSFRPSIPPSLFPLSSFLFPLPSSLFPLPSSLFPLPFGPSVRPSVLPSFLPSFLPSLTIVSTKTEHGECNDLHSEARQIFDVVHVRMQLMHVPCPAPPCQAPPHSYPLCQPLWLALLTGSRLLVPCKAAK